MLSEKEEKIKQQRTPPSQEQVDKKSMHTFSLAILILILIDKSLLHVPLDSKQLL